MKKIIAALAVLTLSSPAYALTLQQAQQELAGMMCSGSTCTSKANGSVTVDNPDIVTTNELTDISTTSTTLVSPAVEGNPRAYDGTLATWCPMITTMNGGKTYPSNVNADCVPQSLNPGKGGISAVYATSTVVTDGGVETIVTDGGTTTSPTCTTTSKELVFNGNATSRDMAWSVNTSSSTSEGAC